MKVTNLGTSTEYVRTKDGTVGIEPKETKNVALANRQSANNVARAHAGVLVFGDEDKPATKSAVSGIDTTKAG